MTIETSTLLVVKSMLSGSWSCRYARGSVGQWDTFGGMATWAPAAVWVAGHLLGCLMPCMVANATQG